MQRISSKDNSLIKHIKKLKEKKYRQQYGEYVVEGLKLIKEAINENGHRFTVAGKEQKKIRLLFHQE